MGWENTNLAETDLTVAPIPKGDYLFRLLGAQYDTNNPSKIVAKAAVADESEFAGRKMRFTYPDPEAYDWSPRVLKRLEQSLGIDAFSGEDPVEYLNRAANDAALFTGEVTHREYLPDGAKEGEEQTAADLNIFTIKPGV